MFRTAYRVLDTYCISVRDSGMSAGIFSCFILVLKTLKEKKKEKREIKRILTACQSRRRKKERERKDDLMEITNPVRRLRKLFWGGQLKIPCPLIGYLPRKKATVDPKSHLSSFSYMPLISFLTTDILYHVVRSSMCYIKFHTSSLSNVRKDRVQTQTISY